MRQRVKILQIGSHGEGIGKLNGQNVFVPKTLPGDEVEIISAVKDKGHFRVLESQIISSGPDRQLSKCKHFDTCGGCDFQHMKYEHQLQWKLQTTKHWIERSPLSNILPQLNIDVIASPDEYHYRHRCKMQVKEGKPGFYKINSKEVVQIDECPIMVHGFFEQMKKEAERLQNERDHLFNFQIGNGVDNHYEVDGNKLYYDRNCFTQANLKVNELMWQTIKTEALKCVKKTRALDLFCGIGNFTVGLENIFHEVIGVEENPISISFAKKNNPRVNWINQKVETFLAKNKKKFDFVLMDPAREGAIESCEFITYLNAPKITYVSCQLNTLIRDLVALQKSYEVSKWTVVDLFPQTKQIECIVSLQKR
eukprot:TRINITY_DN1591_c0_g1_i1.p1 TRINITY_DN1591_c0_g1~~TRINITY_DN1591_c0_g1_i1.p1  ORF type:complete len:375 (+),score=75.46 TRINITY_DN1591_c0_g1_i1:29-1126(+)